jgi:hypothetical protein
VSVWPPRHARRIRPATKRGLCSDCGERFERFAIHGPGNRWRFCEGCYAAWRGERELDAALLEAIERDGREEAA